MIAPRIGFHNPGLPFSGPWSDEPLLSPFSLPRDSSRTKLPQRPIALGTGLLAAEGVSGLRVERAWQ